MRNKDVRIKQKNTMKARLYVAFRLTYLRDQRTKLYLKINEPGPLQAKKALL